MDTAAFIISIFSALAAIAAAVWAKQSADAAERSADAAEREATAAEGALAIEEKRAMHEQDAREEAEAPRLDAGEEHGTAWTLAQQGGAFVGFLTNLGPGAAVVEGVEFGALGEAPEAMPSTELVLAAEETQQVAVPWSLGERLNDPVELAITFASGASEYRAKARFTLRRRGADPNGQPLWTQREARVERLS